MSNQPKKEELLYVATLGRTVGLKGDMKFHDKSDFPEQFQAGATFYIDVNTPVTLAHVNGERGTVRLEGVTSLEAAKRYVNVNLHTTYDATRETCHLEAGEHFWFDIIGCLVVEEGRELGVVVEMERIGVVNYLSVETDKVLVAQGESKHFLIPFQPPFVLHTDVERQRIDVEGGLGLLQAS